MDHAEIALKRLAYVALKGLHTFGMVIIELSVSNHLLKLILVQLVPYIVNEVYFPLAFSNLPIC